MKRAAPVLLALVLAVPAHAAGKQTAFAFRLGWNPVSDAVATFRGFGNAQISRTVTPRLDFVADVGWLRYSDKDEVCIVCSARQNRLTYIPIAAGVRLNAQMGPESPYMEILPTLHIASIRRGLFAGKGDAESTVEESFYGALLGFQMRTGTYIRTSESTGIDLGIHYVFAEAAGRNDNELIVVPDYVPGVDSESRIWSPALGDFGVFLGVRAAIR